MLNLSNRKKLVIGTAQFGYKYGITNNIGKTSKKEIKKILNLQRKYKIFFLEVAEKYNSEEVLKKHNLKKIQLIMKLNNFSGKKLDKNINSFFFRLLSNLKVKSIYCIMLHNVKKLFENNSDEIFKTLTYLKQKKYVKKIGFSTYGTDHINEALNKYKFDVVQTTFNPFDRRILNNHFTKKLKKKGIEIHVRSIFLQGLLLLKSNKIPSKLKKYKDKFRKWENFVKFSGLKPSEVCLNFALSQNFDKVIFGINNHKQLEEIIDSKNQNISIPNNISSNNKYLINPYYWS